MRLAVLALLLSALQESDPYDQSKVPLEVEPADAKAAKIVLVAGRASHGPGDHEYFAGMALLMRMLQQTPGVAPVMVRDGWPKNEKVFEGARSIVFFCDDSARRLVVNGLLWTAKVEVPAGGAKVDLKPEDLNVNLDDKRKKK